MGGKVPINPVATQRFACLLSGVKRLHNRSHTPRNIRLAATGREALG